MQTGACRQAHVCPHYMLTAPALSCSLKSAWAYLSMQAQYRILQPHTHLTVHAGASSYPLLPSLELDVLSQLLPAPSGNEMRVNVLLYMLVLLPSSPAPSGKQKQQAR